MNRKPVSAAACAIMAAALIQAPVQAIAVENPIPPGFTSTARPLVTGQLTDAAGKGVSATAPLVMFAWPSNDVLDNMALGESAKLVPISQTTTDKAGNFIFSAVDAPAAERYSEANEPLNVTIAGSADGSQYWYSTSVDPSIIASTDPTEPKAARTSTQGNADNVGTLSIKPASTDNSGADKTAFVADSGYMEKSACGAIADADLGKTAAQLGTTSNYASGASTRYTFTSGANSTLGVGLSASGAVGSYDASGTSSVTSSYSVGFASNKSGTKRHWTYVRTRRFKTTCYTDNGHVPYLHYYNVRSTSFLGGSATNAGTAFTSLKYCVPIGKGDTHTQNTTTASSWAPRSESISRPVPVSPLLPVCGPTRAHTAGISAASTTTPGQVGPRT